MAKNQGKIVIEADVVIESSMVNEPCEEQTKKISNEATQNTEKPLKSRKIKDLKVDSDRSQNIVAFLNSIIEIPLSDLHPPEFNPFNIVDDEAMESLIEKWCS